MIVYMDLENLLKEKNISKNKLCEACNLQRTQLNNYCKNKVSRIDFTILAKLCEFLDCTPNDILKLSSIKKLSKSYWYVIIFIGLTAFIILRYHSKAQIFFAFIGLLIGIILSIIAMQYSLKRHCKKIDDHSHSSSL